MNFSEPVVLASGSCKLVGISIAKFRKLEDQGHIVGTETTVGQRKYNQYSQRLIEEIAKAWRSSSRASAIESYLGVPRYGVEQLVCLDLLHQESDPAVNALDENLRLTDLSISELRVNLEAVVIRDAPPDDAISLRRLSRWCGGNMKPWGPAIEALLSGQIECWLDPKTQDPLPRSSQFIDRTLVRQADASKLFDAQFERRRYPTFPFSEFLCQEDASDILNADFAQLQPATLVGDLIFERRKGNGQWVDLAAVLALARRTITAGELSHLTGQHCNFVKNLLPRILSIRRAVLGWDRQDLLANWAEVIATIETSNTPDNSRRAASMKLPLGYADASRLRLQASLGPPD